jgi:uncharacterized membrane protein YukC
MITFSIILLVILVIILGYTTFNLLKKNEKLEEITTTYENFINELSEALSFSKNKLDEIDSRGVFKSDDEIGWFFEQIQELQKLLDEFNLKI